ncbi:MAG: DUF4876 domain-containing protein [Ignavibacteriaceae bacterium]
MKSIICSVTIIPLLFFAGLILSGCDKIIDTEEKPIEKERGSEFVINLKDNTGFMQKLYGGASVRNAIVQLKSNSLGLEYTFISDTSGNVIISGLISDKYFISVKRGMLPNELEEIFGEYTKDYVLVNKDQKTVDLNASSLLSHQIELDTIIKSALVISEIYASGPQGSGLYYHDKYIEIFNQSEYIQYLDSMIIAVVYSSSYLGLNYRDDPEFIHSKSIWIFPGSGTEYQILPGQFILCSEDAIDHRMNAPNSVDLSNSDFEFYKDDAPDVDNPGVPNMLRIYQPSGNDWLIGGEKGALIIARYNIGLLVPYSDEFLIPYKNVLDGVEYMSDPTKLNEKMLNPSIDAGTTGGIQFYTGKSMERRVFMNNNKNELVDDNNSSLDFLIINKPSPGYHHNWVGSGNSR